MEVSRWLTNVLIVSMTVMTRADVWLETPGDLHVCEGEIAEFPWSFQVESGVEVLSTHWFHMTDGGTIMEAISGSVHSVFAGYVGRVDLLPGKNAGLLLRNVTTDDRGPYRVEVAAKPQRMSSDGTLNVYEPSKLTQSVSYKGSKIFHATTVNHTCCEPPKFYMNSSEKTTVIVKSQKDGVSTHVHTYNVPCTLTCDVTLPFNQSGNYSVTLTFKYPACEATTWRFYVYVYEDPVKSDSSSLAGIIAVSVIAPVVVIAVLVTVIVVCIRRHQPTTKPHQETDTETAHLSETIELTDGTYTEMVDLNIKEAPSSDPNQVDAEPAEEATEESQLDPTNVVTEQGIDIVDNYFSPPEGSSVDGTPIVISRQESKTSLCNNNKTNPGIYPHHSNAKSKVTVEEPSSTDANVDDVDEYGTDIAKGI